MKRSTLTKILVLQTALFLTACGQVGKQAYQSEEDQLMDEAMEALEASPANSMSYESQNHEVGRLLATALPDEDEIVFSSSKGRGVAGTRPNGVQFSRQGSSFVTDSGYSVFSGSARRYNPNNGNSAAAGGIWIPTVGAVGYAVGYSPTKGFALAIGGAGPNGAGGIVCTTSAGCQSKY